MQVESDKDFRELRKQITVWKQRFPMFRHDVNQVESIIETHIQNYSIALVFHRQTHKKKFLEDAEQEIAAINRVISTVSKLEMIALLSQS
jgi:predicted  nucleic acid-binding Zn-ribbon protein